MDTKMNMNLKFLMAGLFSGCLNKVETETVKCSIGTTTGNIFYTTTDKVVLEINVQDWKLDTAKELYSIAQAEYTAPNTTILDADNFRAALMNSICKVDDSNRALALFASIFSTLITFDSMELKVAKLDDDSFIILGVDTDASVLLRASIKRKGQSDGT